MAEAIDGALRIQLCYGLALFEAKVYIQKLMYWKIHRSELETHSRSEIPKLRTAVQACEHIITGQSNQA